MQKFKFFKSGLYNEPCFYTDYDIQWVFDNIDYDEDRSYREHVSYNYDLMKTRYSEVELNNLDEDQVNELIDDDLFEDINNHYTLYSPSIFNENVALDCGLIPFTYNWHNKSINLLALGDSGFDPSIKTNLLFKLDAYQVLSDNSIDEHSQLFATYANENIAKRVLGDEVYNRIIEAINGEVIR